MNALKSLHFSFQHFKLHYELRMQFFGNMEPPKSITELPTK